MFPKTIDLMSDYDRDFLNQKTIDRLNRIACQLRVIFSSNSDVEFHFSFSDGESGGGSRLMSMELLADNCSIYTGV